MPLEKISQEVFFSREKVTLLERNEINFLKKMALKSKRGRSRLCAHKDINERLHEMFVVHRRGAYVRPHKHLNSSESLHVIEGRALLLLFDDKGTVSAAVRLGKYGSTGKFYYRISRPLYHSLIIKTEFFIFHEALNGPFNRANNIAAAWSPAEGDSALAQNYMKRIESLGRKSLKKTQ